MDYDEFLRRKSQIGGKHGFTPKRLPGFLYDFQRDLTTWALEKGKAAIFADTGLGKTPMQLAWAQTVTEETNGNVLILTPLAVSRQTISEGAKFGIEIVRSRDGRPKGKITVTNYQQLEKFDPNDYVGLVCDESSAIKDFTGQTKTGVTRFANKLKYRSFWTATPSPNDYVELGTSSEALGELKYMDMVDRFFRDTSNDLNPQWSTPKYVLKKHAVSDFWRWVSSWARAIKKPSDLGYADERFVLPQLIEREHIVEATMPLPGELFVRKARTLKDQREERKMTMVQRVEKVAELVAGHEISVIWGHFNYECDYMEKVIPGSVQISGSDSDDEKEEKFDAFASSEIPNLIIKPKIGAFGLNWQHCNHMTFFPSHSYEQYYQGVRRCWRYGQTRPVVVDIVTTEGELGVYNNIKRKSADAAAMFAELVKHMRDELALEAKTHTKQIIKVPSWI